MQQSKASSSAAPWGPGTTASPQVPSSAGTWCGATMPFMRGRYKAPGNKGDDGVFIPKGAGESGRGQREDECLP